MRCSTPGKRTVSRRSNGTPSGRAAIHGNDCSRMPVSTSNAARRSTRGSSSLLVRPRASAPPSDGTIAAPATNRSVGNTRSVNVQPCHAVLPTVLYQVVQSVWASVRALPDASERVLPRFCAREVEAYLRCGIGPGG